MSQSTTRRYITSLLFFILLTPSAFAQLFFTSGYVVLATSNTLTGELREQGNHLIQFRPNTSVASRSFTPSQVTTYVADNNIRRSVRLTENGRDSTYFMYEQVNGYVGLYRLFSPEGRLTHALRLPNNTFVPLRGTLTLLALTSNLNQCTAPAFTRLLNPQSFRALSSDLERVVKAYNACVGLDQPMSQPAQKKRLRYELGLSAGFARNS
jgi:hypothetical protein